MVYEKVLDDVVVLMLFFFCSMFQTYVGGMFQVSFSFSFPFSFLFFSSLIFNSRQEQVQLLFSNVTTIEKRFFFSFPFLFFSSFVNFSSLLFH